jgi:hypothetical protein
LERKTEEEVIHDTKESEQEDVQDKE